MIDTLLALVPTYGLWLIFGSVALSCLALPLPSSMLVMAAGGFAAAGDFTYWSLVLAAYAGFVLGDQFAFLLARNAGAPLIDRLKTRAKAAKAITKAEDLTNRYGAFAVFITRSILSPIGPYVNFVSGALKAPWVPFSIASVTGALPWCFGYSGLGYAFSGNISELASMIESSVGIVVTGAILIAIAIWLIGSYRKAH